MGRQGRTCGAVTGAYMVLGLEAGSEHRDPSQAKERAYELVRAFSESFEERNGSLDCRDLLGHDLSTSEGREKAKREGLFDTLCPKLVRCAAEILERMLH